MNIRQKIISVRSQYFSQIIVNNERIPANCFILLTNWSMTIVLQLCLSLHTFIIDFLIISVLRLTMPANALLQFHPFLFVTFHTFLAPLCLNFPLWIWLL